MKTALVATILALTSLNAMAAPISLAPGSSIVINGELVTCQGPSQDALAPACSIKQDGNTYRVFVGQTIANSYYAFNQALEAVKELKELNLCR